MDKYLKNIIILLEKVAKEIDSFLKYNLETLNIDLIVEFNQIKDSLLLIKRKITKIKNELKKEVKPKNKP